MRPHAPSATAGQEIKEGGEDRAAVMWEGATACNGLGQQRLPDAPCAVAHSARIWLACAHAVQPLATKDPTTLLDALSDSDIVHREVWGVPVGHWGV